jgi:hypothetical protein
MCEFKQFPQIHTLEQRMYLLEVVSIHNSAGGGYRFALGQVGHCGMFQLYQMILFSFSMLDTIYFSSRLPSRPCCFATTSAVLVGEGQALMAEHPTFPSIRVSKA